MRRRRQPIRSSPLRRVRRLVRRHPSLRWIAIVVLAAGGASVVHGTVAQAEQARHRWGTEVPVLVATRRIDAGEPIRGAVERRTWPAALVPPSAVDPSTGEVDDRVALAPIAAGQVVVRDALAPDGLDGLAALIPDGWRGIAVPTSDTALALRIGDRVDLVAAVDTQTLTAASGGPPAFAVSEDDVVVAVDARALTVAVPEEDATRVAFAVATGSVVPVLRST